MPVSPDTGLPLVRVPFESPLLGACTLEHVYMTADDGLLHYASPMQSKETYYSVKRDLLLLHYASPVQMMCRLVHEGTATWSGAPDICNEVSS